MGIAIQKDSLYLLLCEGKADCAFFRSLQKQRSSFPNVQIEGIGGKDRLYDVLVGLLLDPPKVKQLKGILIAYDTADDPVKTFEIIKNQIARTDFSVPTKLFDIKTKTGELPFICVMLIPDENTPGGLESLCNQYLESSHSWIKACISAFLSCGNTAALKWSAEKLDKARFASMIAVTNEADPSKALSYAFSSDSGAAPVIPVSAPCFDYVEKRIKEYCAKTV